MLDYTEIYDIHEQEDFWFFNHLELCFTALDY